MTIATSVVSIVIPAYNAEKVLGHCLDALLAQTAPRDEYEIIVADDGSTDGTRQVAESRAVRVVTQPNRGAGAARNLGAQHACGDIVLFLDADSAPDARWIEAMTAPFNDPTIAGASGEKKTRQKNLWARFVQIEYDFKYDRIAAHSKIDFVDSSTAAYRREVFLSNGGFDTSLMEAEDVELSFRLAERGYRMVLIRDAITYHTHPESLRHYLKRKFQYARWRAIVYARYPRKAASDQRTPLTQKFQPLLAFALVPTLFAAFIWNLLAWVAVIIALLFVATTLPFAAYCRRRSWLVALVVPLTLWLSAYASGAGAVLGFVQRPVQIKLEDSRLP